MSSRGRARSGPGLYVWTRERTGEPFPANKSSRAPLRMLGPDGQPLSRKYYSAKTERDLDADEIVRGYEVKRENLLLSPMRNWTVWLLEKTRDIDLKRFVPEESIPPVYFERGYFLTPSAGSEKAYSFCLKQWRRRVRRD